MVDGISDSGERNGGSMVLGISRCCGLGLHRHLLVSFVF